MATKGRVSKHFLICVAILLIHMWVVNSQGHPQVSDMIVELSQTDAQMDHVREKRDAATTTKTTNSTNTAATTTSSTTTNSTNTAVTTTNSTTTNS
ncbi:hypothetical protein PDJAM_G00085500, partial [Pangasius djambal]|nr:hypothetical protein [Pangasius djambal]